MALEIERKYLINHIQWNALEKGKGILIRQGYISTDPHKTIRVRLVDELAYLTIKGINEGMTRTEFEYEIPRLDAEKLLANFSSSELSKLRYEIMHQGKKWEVDEFLGENEGLIVAEIELDSEDEKFDLPEWIREEVTSQEKYYNSNLTQHPFKNWNYDLSQ